MLTNNQVVELLKAASGYDGRRPNDPARDAWAEQAKRGRWTYAEALEAIHDHYAETEKWIMPVVISAKIKEARRQRAEAERRATEAARTVDAAGQERVRTAVAEIAMRLGMPVDPDHDEARRVIKCPHCGAMPGERCVNPQTGRPLRESPGHDSRVEAMIAARSAPNPPR